MAFRWLQVTLLLAIVGVAQVAMAGLPPHCVERFERKVGEQAKAVDAAVQARARLGDIGRKILAARSEALRYVRGRWAADCSKAHADNKARMNQYIQKELLPALNRAAVAFRNVCMRHGMEKLDGRLKSIQRAVAAGNPKEIDRQNKFLATQIQRDPVLKPCKPFHAKVEELRKTVFAKGKADAAIIHAKKQAAVCSIPVQHISRIDSGLQSFQRGQPTEISLPSLHSLTNSIAKCNRAIDAVQSVKVPLHEVSIAAGNSSAAPKMTLAEIKILLAKVRPKTLLDRGKKHNQKWKAWAIARWKKKYIKGSGMRKVHKSHGESVVPRVRDLGSTIVWTYRTSYSNRPLAECEEYVFSRRGSLKRRRAYACP